MRPERWFSTIDWSYWWLYLLIAAMVGVAIYSVSLWFLEPFASSKTSLDETNSELLRDEVFHFSARAPAPWIVDRADDPESNLRFALTLPDKSTYVAFYAFSVTGTVDHEKLVDADRKMFPALGPQEGERSVRTHLGIITTERLYGSNDRKLYARARFMCTSRYGYVAIAYSRSRDVTPAEPILDSLDPTVSLSLKIKNKLTAIFSFSNLVGSIMGIIGSLIAIVIILIPICIVLVPFGLIGLEIRKGLDTLRALRQMKREFEARGQKVNARYYSIRRVSTFRVLGIPLALMIAWAVLFKVLPDRWFKLSLLGLIAVVAGMMGAFLVPGFGLEDALDDFVDV